MQENILMANKKNKLFSKCPSDISLGEDSANSVSEFTFTFFPSLSLSHHCTTIMGLSVHRKYLMQPLYQVNTFPLIAKYKSKSTLGQKQGPWQLYLHVLKVWSNLLTGRHFRNWIYWQLSILGRDGMRLAGTRVLLLNIFVNIFSVKGKRDAHQQREPKQEY